MRRRNIVSGLRLTLLLSTLAVGSVANAGLKGRANGVVGMFQVLHPGDTNTHLGILGVGDPHNSNTGDDPIWLNANVNIVAYRIDWATIETKNTNPPGTPPTIINWAQVDQVVTKAQATGKQIGIFFMVGTDAPSWLYDGTLGTGVTVQPFYIDNGSGVLGTGGKMPLPWDKTFQARWQSFIAAAGAQYDGNPQVRYLQMEGLSPGGECYFCHYQTEVNEMIKIAGGAGTTDPTSPGLTDWKDAGQTITSYYVASFPTTRLFWASGAPLPGDDTAFVEMVATDPGALMLAYPHRVGIKSNGLYGGSKGYPEQNGCKWNATNPIGFQTARAFDNTQFTDAVETAAACFSTNSACGDFVEEIVGKANPSACSSPAPSPSPTGLNNTCAPTIQQANTLLSANQVND